VGDYRDLGYLPETLVNFLALLGWNPGGDEEFMERARLIELFTLEKINPKSAVFDEKKLEWLNGQYFLKRDVEFFLPIVKAEWAKAGVDPNAWPDAYFRTAVGLLKDRSKRIPDFVNYGMYFFREPEAYEEKAARKYFGAGADALLDALRTGIAGLGDYTTGSLEALYKETAEKLGKKGGDLIHPTRLAVSGLPFGPGLYELMAALGKDAVLRRLQAAADAIRAGAVKTVAVA
jgi:glutamyl-tRNA synthetase